MPALLDATILSNFAAVGHLDLLRLIIGEAAVARQVSEELRRGVALGFAFLSSIEPHISTSETQGWLTLVDIEGETEAALYRTLAVDLGVGEAASLAVARARGWSFYSDDRAARAAAEAMAVPLSGTLGVLLRLVRTETLTVDDANALLRQMIVRARYRSPVTDLRDLGPL